MVRFKEWEDYTMFLLEYCPCTCLNCKYGTDGDIHKKQFVCMKTLSPVRLDMVRLCVEWENTDGETLKDYGGEFIINIHPKIAEELEKGDKLLSFDEIKEFVEDFDYGVD